MKMKEMSENLFRLVYCKVMPEDFEESEIKKFDLICSLKENCQYYTYGLFEGDELYGYAFFLTNEEDSYVFLDYIAVMERFRGKGYGDKMQELMADVFGKQYDFLIAEVEDPEYSKDIRNEYSRKGRISYYEKNKFEVTTIKSRVLEDHYMIITKSLNGKELKRPLKEILEQVYIQFFGDEFYNTNIDILG